MSRQAAAVLAMAGLIAACSPAPAPSKTSTDEPEPSTPTATAPPGAVVVVRAGGRAHCEWIVGCGVFLEFVPTTEAVPGDPPTWDPRDATDLRTGQAGEHGDAWVEVFDTEDRVPPVAPGTYRVVAGLYWADDTNTPRPEDPFPVVEVPFACATPLEVDEVSELVTVALQLEPDGTCSLLASAEPVSGGVPVTFSATGELDCPSYYGCQAVLAVLALRTGATPPPAWYEHARVEFETVFDDWHRLAGAPLDPPASIGPGEYVIVAGTRFTSDLVSPDPDGAPVFQEIGADTCEAPLVVGPGATSIAISIDYDSDGASCAIEATVD